MKTGCISILLILISIVAVKSQNGIVEGRVFDELTNEALPFANVYIQGTTIGSATDEHGSYKIENLSPGVYNLEATYIGYDVGFASEISVANNAPTKVNFALRESTLEIEEVQVKASPFQRSDVAPISLNSIGVNEIQRSPGGNRDISKVIQTLPGVSTGASFRNDLIVRGGAPNENRFYIDDIEVPNINHFVTQGASGGSNGLINVDFINNVDFYSAAFPANRGNALSSLIEFRQKEGRTDRIGLTGTFGASDFGATLEGPMSKSKKSSFLLSARVSYLQWLFKALQLPFLPTYVDYQYKSFHKFNNKHDLTFIGLGAYDNFTLNLDNNETDEQRFFLGVLPYQNQYNYTVGARYRFFRNDGYYTFVASRNQLGYKLFKFLDNENDNPAKQIYDYISREAENKLRIEHTVRKKGYKINYGVNYEYAQYFNKTEAKQVVNGQIEETFYESNLGISKYGFFTQVSRKYVNDKLGISLGFRIDGNNYNSATKNPWQQFSPRASISYAITPGLTINANTGIYYQLPPYTVLGFKDQNDVLINRLNGVKYIRNFQAVGGFAYITSFNAKFSIEGFYKKYDDYPLLTDGGISLANLGGDFGVIGIEEAISGSKGKTFGAEFLFQQKLYKGFYGIITYTFYRSLFTNGDDDIYTPSAWDNKHIVTLVGGKKFKKNWEIGLKWTFYGGAPYTPFDVALSVQRDEWNTTNEGQLDYNQISLQRLKPVHRLDIRIDKKWFFKKWTANIYLDISNVYNNKASVQDELTVERNELGQPIIDPDDSNSYLPKFIPNENGVLIPTVGIVVSY